MKKILGAVFASVLFGANLFAYNPPAGGQNALRLTSPWLLSSSSAAGGALFGITPGSIINNPALTAWEQRNTLELGATLFLNSNTDDPLADDPTLSNSSHEGNKIGEGFQAGLLIPSRWMVSTFLFQGVWTKAFDMPIGDSINATAGLSKDITDQVSVGLSANFGYVYGDLVKNDWTASAALGAYYNHGELSFMKDVRFGASINNLGKMYSKNDESFGIKSSKAIKDKNYNGPENTTMWPGIATLRLGAAATMLKTDALDLGLSLDFSAPGFQDFVTDVGLQLSFWDFLKISSSWEFDVQEFANDAKNLIPSVGVSFKFLFEKSGSYMEKHGWAQSDMTVGAAWKQMYENINAVSAGAILNLGMADTKAPEITLWGED